MMTVNLDDHYQRCGDCDRVMIGVMRPRPRSPDQTVARRFCFECKGKPCVPDSAEALAERRMERGER